MIYVRGLPEDYEGWRQKGCAGWSWSDVQPYFRKQERHVDSVAGTDNHGLAISDTAMENRMLDHMVEAFEQAGAPTSDDLNDTTREGVMRVRMTASRGLRVSSAKAYLHPAMGRSNLKVITRAHASRILFDGRRAVGVEYYCDGTRCEIRAAREVILSGGAINSPQLLELSGIGDAQRLQKLGIAIVHHSPQVGENLQDHYASMIRARAKPGITGINEMSRGIRLVGQALRYVFTRSGLLSLGGSNLTAFLKSDPALDLPDLQFFASPGTVDFEELAINGRMSMEREPGVTIGGYVMRPRSSGNIHIETSEFHDSPVIRPNFLSDPADCIAQVASLRWARRIFESPALARFIDHELTPGKAVQSDEELLAFARAAGSTGYHQAGTCAMGASQEHVLTPDLKVNGVEGLRVVDASVMPSVVSGNTHAATVMIAEKASDLIRAAM